ncbi:MAG: hypothetical protein GY785_17700 [Gammaproteobacteria bacterium]|nr:hypothetical protein [Gammaproteobacteria bacterium]
MNTPAHVIINLLVLSRQPDHRRSVVIVAGALLPDLVIIVFYGWHLLLGTSESQIWSVEYYRPLWQAGIDSFNSIPLISLAMLLSWYARQYLLLIFFSSMLLHIFGDLPLHHDDAHRHFFPFSEWRFQSPVSYWDPAHHGAWAGLVEFVCVLAAALWMYRRWTLLRPWVAVTTAVYLLYWVYVFMVWA